LSAENYTRALRKLLRARRIWPEYFGTDFLIALVYEGQGDYNTAARYYKGYLTKLKTFEAGEYPISGRVIRSIITSEADKYDLASDLVEDYLASLNIDIDDVTIPFSAPLSLILFVIFAFFCSVTYAAVHYFIAPYIKKQKRIKTIITGYWICKNCGTANLTLITECEECGNKK
ncbi:MAG: tetratricopeptide repeat protein, partial [Candidatus Omnitrophota bacterium]